MSTEPVAVDPGEWAHYVVSRDSISQEVLFYVDGVQLGLPVAFTNLPTGAGAGTLFIGSGVGGAGGFDGLIDELTLYSEVITPSAVFVGPTPGDLNGDGSVDLDDWFDHFLPNFGETVGPAGDPATLASGDLDFDGDVDLTDFDAFQSAYLEANPNAEALSFDNPAPEPQSALLLLIPGALIGWRCLHRGPGLDGAGAGAGARGFRDLS